MLFSAHGLPEAYIRRGDPYLDDIRITVEAVTRRLGLGARARLCFQSRVGPQRWLGPSTEAVLDEMAAAGETRGRRRPIAFTGEHIETLQEIDILFRERAEQAGIVHFARARTVGCHPAFIAALADLVEATAPARGWTSACASRSSAAASPAWRPPTSPAARGHDVALVDDAAGPAAASSAARGATGFCASAGRRRCSTGPKRPGR